MTWKATSSQLEFQRETVSDICYLFFFGPMDCLAQVFCFSLRTICRRKGSLTAVPAGSRIYNHMEERSDYSLPLDPAVAATRAKWFQVR